MPNGDPRDGFFYSTLTLMIDSYKTAPQKTADLGLQCFQKRINSGSAGQDMMIGKPSQNKPFVKDIISFMNDNAV